MLRFVAFVAFLLPLSVAPALKTAEIATKEKAPGMIERTQDKFERWSGDIVTTNKEVGFNDRNFDPCICDLDGASSARGTSPALIGKEFANRDDGIRLNGEMMEVVDGSRYNRDDYKRLNLLDKVIEAKKCDREARGDSLVGVGVYRS
jgi:hypothetical protein